MDNVIIEDDERDEDELEEIRLSALREEHQAALAAKYKYPERECNYERFARDIKNHRMTVLHFEPPYVHLMFSRPDSGCYRFDLISAPWQMIMTGDMGTWVFSRERDMWDFFKTNAKMDEKYLFDAHYWLQKCDAIDRNGAEHFSFEKLIANVVEQIGEDDRLSEDAKDELISSLEAYEGDSRQSVLEFLDGYEIADSKGCGHFRPFAQPDIPATVYTFGFLWACYAIAWGVKQYHLAFTEAKEATND